MKTILFNIILPLLDIVTDLRLIRLYFGIYGCIKSGAFGGDLTWIWSEYDEYGML